MLGVMPEVSEQDEDLPARQFGWWDMFVSPENDPRASDGRFQGERATLTGYLRDQRLTLELKCAGLAAAGLARRSVPPSNLSLLGLVRHLTDTERGWFRRTLAGQEAPRLYRTDDDPDLAFNGAAPDPRRSRRPGPAGGPRSSSLSSSRPARRTSTCPARTTAGPATRSPSPSARCWCT
jgi:hypothetical protein